MTGLASKTVRLRALTSADLEILRTFINDPDVLKFSNAYHPVTDQQQEAWWRSLGGSGSYWFGIEEQATHRLIGTCCLVEVDWIARLAELRIRIGDKEAWGRALGTEACELLVRYGFEHLNLERIWLRVFAKNQAALKLYSRLGFVQEGCLRRAWHLAGETGDVIVMGLLREEWTATPDDRR